MIIEKAKLSEKIGRNVTGLVKDSRTAITSGGSAFLLPFLKLILSGLIQANLAWDILRIKLKGSKKNIFEFGLPFTTIGN